MNSQSTAVAYSNIALVKYWGKRNERLVLPASSSISLTLDVYSTTTTVRFDSSLPEDAITLNSAALSGGQRSRVSDFLDLVRTRAGISTRADVVSTNSVPTGAGLASSASGFAALAGAAAAACGLDLDDRELSRLARRGSGSASRSIFGGYALWHAADTDAESYAEPIDGSNMPVSMVIALVDAHEKPISSREAMRRTVATSPFYAPWIESSERDIDPMLHAIAAGDFTALGEIAESNALRMHATLLGARPPLTYWQPQTVAILHRCVELRGAGIECYATLDAGPNVKILCRPEDVPVIRDGLSDTLDASAMVTASAGPGIAVTTAVSA